MDPDGEETLSIDADVDDEVCATATLSESFTIANTDDDIASTSVSVASFIDGQPVQLEDGSTAFIYHKIKDSISNQLVQAIDLEDGTTAYIHHPNPSTSTSMTQTDLAIDEEKNTPNYRCDAEGCGKIYTTSHHLRVHKRTHTGEKPFVCGWKDCEKSFSTSYAVKSHIRVHTGEKPYDCNYPGCRKAFKTAGDLQKHNRTHTGEKPFKCPFEGCEKAFTTSNICKVHIRTHTGERPYKCPFPECDKAFATATNYKNHVRIHTGEKPFACEEPGCGKRFTEYSSFYKHQIVHAERNAYRCRQCGKFYSHTSTLLVHRRTIHNDESAIQECEMQMERRKPSKRPKMAKHIEPSIPVFEKKQIDKEETSDQHRMVLLPITTLENSTEAQASNSSQVAAVMTSESGQQLAILSHDGSTQQFTLALTDQGSTILLPNSDSSRTTEAESNVTLETPVKRENPILYIAGSGASGSILSAADKDNTLQRIEAIEHTSDSTPINTDIWLHQPQKEDIPEIQENRDNGIKNLVKEEENISVQFEPSTQNPCEDPANADSIAYLEIGGAKYQLKIVSSENDSISVDRPTLF